MSWSFFILVLIAAIAFIPLFTIFKLTSFKLLSGKISIIDAKTIPQEQVDFLILGERFAIKQGFVYKAHVTRGPVVSGQPWGLYGALYFHEESNTWAFIYVEPMIHAIFSWRLMLITPTANGGSIATVSGSEFDNSVCPSNYKIHDAMLYSPKRQWEYHLNILNELQINTTSSNTSLFEALLISESLFFQGLVDTKTVIPWEDGYRIPVKYGFKLWKRMQLIQKRLGAQKKSLDNTNDLHDSPRSQSFAYHTHKEIQESNTTNTLSKIGILFISVVLFGLSFGLIFTWQTLLLLIVVLFVHELGHLLGMWIFGYKDLRMLFIPFMGALASGKKKNVNTWQEAIILLLGPVPGYVVGVIILIGMPIELPSWLIQYGIISLVLNAINMLPFMPLDGGRIINLALFNRLPIFQLVLIMTSIFALGYAGIFWEERIALIIATILIISLPSIWKEIQLLRHLLKKKAHKRNLNTVELISELNNHPIWGQQLPQDRWQLLESLTYRVQHASTGVVSSIGIFIVWFSFIVFPPYLSITGENISKIVNVLAMEVQEQLSIDELAENYNNSDNDRTKIQIALQLSMRLSTSETQQGITYWNELNNILTSADLTENERGGYYYQMSSSCRYYEDNCEDDYLKKALEWFKRSNENTEQAISALTDLAQLESETTDNQLHYLTQAETISQEINQAKQWLPEIYLLRGFVYESKGDIDSAEKYFLKTIEIYNDRKYSYSTHYHRALIEFYERHNKHDKSISTLKYWVSNETYKNNKLVIMQEDLHYLLVWLLIEPNPKEAKYYLQNIKPVHTADKVELALANLMMDRKLGIDTSKTQLEHITWLVNSVENDYEWAYLNYSLNIDDATNYDYENSVERSNVLSIDWYSKMGNLISEPKFLFVESAIKKYQEYLE